MFAADLSWTDQHDEKVGERRTRKAKERDGSIKSASTGTGTGTGTERRKSNSRKGSTSTPTNDRSSTPSTTRRPSLWTWSSLASTKDDTKNWRKKSNDQRNDTSIAEVQSGELSPPLDDLSLQSNWTISTKLPFALPSERLVEYSPKGKSTAPQSQNDFSPSSVPPPPFPSSRSNSLAGQVTVETSLQRIDEVVTHTPKDSKDILRKLPILRTSQADTQGGHDGPIDVVAEASLGPRPPVPPKDNVQTSGEKTLPNLRDLPGSFQGLDIGTTTVIWSDAKFDKPTRRPSVLRHKRSGSGLSTLSTTPEHPSTHKDSIDGNSLGPVKETHGSSPSTSSSFTEEWSGTHPPSPRPLTHFQSFIRRVELGGLRTVYDHLMEDWQDPEDDVSKAEIALEKRLWILTALHLRNISEKFLISGKPDFPSKTLGVRNVLELDGNIAETLQLSALCPDASVLYLSTRLIPKLEIPNQISCSSISPAELPRLPYPSSSLELIRASTLPSLLSAAQIPSLLTECYRVLVPGGTLELRLIDPLPDRKSSGPMLRAWIEVRLLLNLEMSFRCTRPSLLIPQWVQAAGFTLQPGRSRSASQTLKDSFSAKRNRSMSEALSLAHTMQVPAAVDNQGVVGAYMDEEVGSMVGRELWKDVWGEFVTKRRGEEQWWWENGGCLKEAIERGTKWNILTLLAVKPE